MKTPFSAEEIKKAVKSLKNGKSAGIDDITAEMLKYGPEVIHQVIYQGRSSLRLKYPKRS